MIGSEDGGGGGWTCLFCGLYCFFRAFHFSFFFCFLFFFKYYHAPKGHLFSPSSNALKLSPMPLSFRPCALATVMNYQVPDLCPVFWHLVLDFLDWFSFLSFVYVLIFPFLCTTCAPFWFFFLCVNLCIHKLAALKGVRTETVGVLLVFLLTFNL